MPLTSERKRVEMLCAYIGPLPAEVQNVTVFSIGLDARAKEPAAAKALAQFLTAPAAQPVIRKHGLEPA